MIRNFTKTLDVLIYNLETELENVLNEVERHREIIKRSEIKILDMQDCLIKLKEAKNDN